MTELTNNLYYDPWYRFNRIIIAIDKLIPNLTGTNLLDLGCHQGQFIKLMIDKYQVKATGIDDWPEELKNDKSWRYFQRNLEKSFDLSSEKFEIISALEVLEHMTDTDLFLENCFAHLKNNGYLIISTPNINSLRNRIQVPLGKYPNGLEYKNLIHHVRLYNVPCLKNHLQEHNFKVLKIIGVNFLPVDYLSKYPVRKTSDYLADIFPQFCNNMIVIAQKVR